MSLVLYKTQDSGYYYIVEIGGPTDTVRFGEGETPAKAASSLEGTQYQSADLRCCAPAYDKLHRWFKEVCPDTVLVACTCDEESQAEAAVFE